MPRIDLDAIPGLTGCDYPAPYNLAPTRASIGR